MAMATNLDHDSAIILHRHSEVDHVRKRVLEKLMKELVVVRILVQVGSKESLSIAIIKNTLKLKKHT